MGCWQVGEDGRDVKVEDSLCRGQGERPAASRPCGSYPCNLNWAEGVWSEVREEGREGGRE